MIRQPPKSTLFPYPTLFQSASVISGTILAEPVVSALLAWMILAEKPGLATLLGGAVVLFGLFQDRKSTRLNSSHANISYAVFCLKQKEFLQPHDVVLVSHHR